MTCMNIENKIMDEKQSYFTINAMDEFEQCEMKLTTWTTLYHMNENDKF